MKTKEEIVQEIVGDNNPDYFDVSMSSSLVTDAMSEYAKECIRELVTYGDDMKILKAWQHDGKISTATDEDNLQKWMNTL